MAYIFAALFVAGSTLIIYCDVTGKNVHEVWDWFSNKTLLGVFLTSKDRGFTKF